MELLKSLDFVDVIKQVEDKEKMERIQTLIDSFNDVALFEKGEKKLKTGQELLNEL